VRRVLEKAELRMRAKKVKNVSLPTSTTTATIGLQKREVVKEGTLRARDHLHALTARMFYTTSLPFNLAKNSYLIQSYTPPG